MSGSEKTEVDSSAPLEILFSNNMISERHPVPMIYYPSDVSQSDPAKQCDKDNDPNHVEPPDSVEVDKAIEILTITVR